MRPKLVGAVIIILLLMVGCSFTATPLPAQPTKAEIVVVQPTKADVIVQETESPVPTPISPIPTPNNGASLENSLSAPTKGFGNVGGILLTAKPQVEDSLIPVPRTLVFLAPLIYTADGRAVVASLDQDKDPSAATSPTGVFVFRNVPAGKYGLVVLHGIGLYLITDEDGADYIVTVEAEKAINLGEVIADLPPL